MTESPLTPETFLLVEGEVQAGIAADYAPEGTDVFVYEPGVDLDTTPFAGHSVILIPAPRFRKISRQWEHADRLWGQLKGVASDLRVVTSSASLGAALKKITEADRQRALQTILDSAQEEFPPHPDIVSRQAAHAARVRALGIDLSLYSTPELEAVQRAAQAVGCSPESALLVALSRVSALTGPRVCLNVGEDISLNFYAGLVGVAGTGKDRALRAGHLLLPFPDKVRLLDMGSGEGLIDGYLSDASEDDDIQGLEPTAKVQVHDRAVMLEPESDKLFQLVQRRGATLASNLLKMWSGVRVGDGNATQETRRRLDDGSYRFSAVMGFQPSKISSLLAMSDIGFPHRFLLASVVPEKRNRGRSPHVPPLADRAAWLSSLTEMNVALDPRVLDRLDDLSEEQLLSVFEPDRDALASHTWAVLAKTVSLLALFHGRSLATLEDLTLAEALWSATSTVREFADGQATRDRTKEAVDYARQMSLVDGFRQDARNAREGGSDLMGKALERLVNRVKRHEQSEEAAVVKTGACSVRAAKQAIDSRLMNRLKGAALAENTQAVLDEAVRRGLVSVSGDSVILR